MTNVASLTTGGSKYNDHFVCLAQLWSSQWGFGGSTNSCIDGLSFQIGKIHLLFGVIGLVLLFIKSRYQKVLLFTLLGTVFSAIMLLQISQPIWESLSILHYIQFPWRYLQFIGFFLSLTGGVVITQLDTIFRFDKQRQYATWGGVCLSVIVVLFFYAKYFVPQTYVKTDQKQTVRTTILWDISKISDEYLPGDFMKPSSKNEVAVVPLIAKNSRITVLTNKNPAS